jgi:hypothetical protein
MIKTILFRELWKIKKNLVYYHAFIDAHIKNSLLIKFKYFIKNFEETKK